MTGRQRFAGWLYFAFQLLVLPDILWLINGYLPRPLDLAQLNILMFSLNFVVVLLIFHKFLWSNLKHACKNLWKTLKTAFLAFCVYYVANMLLNYLIFWIDPGFSNVNDNNIQAQAADHFGLMALCVVVLAPIAEETLYRGLLFGRLYSKNRFLGYAVGTLVFALVHILGYMGQYDALRLGLCLLQYIPAGLALSWAYVETDSIWAPVLMHMTINLIGILAMR